MALAGGPFQGNTSTESDARITAGHARALLALPDAASMQRAVDEITKRELNVRQTEILVRRLNEPPPEAVPPPRPAPEFEAQLRHLEGRFRSALGTKVSLSRNQDGTGRLVVHLYSDDDLESIYRLIAGEENG